MRYVLFATAGHVDHGKTSLIRALTGTDTDRLPEEKRRGLSIDLGFAHLDFPEIGVRLELIDVPGHERFVKNAIAGLSTVSGVLLVVDACEGVMPQTEEHLRVARGVGVRRGVAVLTKIDRAGEDLLGLAEEEVRDLLRREGLSFPVVRVSALTGEGLGDLKRALKDLLAEMEEPPDRPLRIVVDSAFTVRGYGTVLRGSCVEGKVKVGERVVVEPLGKGSKVRAIQNHGRFVETAVAGERVALNLPDIDRGEVERGFWILKEGTYVKGKLLIVELKEEVKTGRAYRLFFGMREVEGRFRSVKEGVYLLRLREEVVSRRGDRVIVLDSGGRFLTYGEVLHPKVRVSRKSFIREHIGDLRERFTLYLLREKGAEGLSGEEILSLTGELSTPPEAVSVGGRFYLKELVADLSERLRRLLESAGKPPEKAYLLKTLSVNEDLLLRMLSDGGWRVVEGVVVKDREEEQPYGEELERLLRILGDRFLEEERILSAGVGRDVLRFALRKGYVHRLGERLLISDRTLRELTAKLRTLGDEFSVQSAKALLGLSRKYLIPLLEYLDHLRLTVREGNVRRWVR